MVLEKNREDVVMAKEEEEFDLDQNQRSVIMKGKRTKRSRQTSPPYLAGTSSSNSTGAAVSYYSVSSPEEDEDMANCLILLAQGIHSQDKPLSPEIKNFAGAASAAAGGFEAYECKTCNRTFQSFQALGGHRASHKKPKIATTQSANIPATATHVLISDLDHDHDHDRRVEDEKMRTLITTHSSTTCTTTTTITKVHECSICGAEFSSGQALGGHMRRHRAPAPAPAQAPVVKGQMMMMNYSKEEEDQEKKNGNLLGLDLNLPAPIDQDDNNNSFQFLSSKMVFSGPSLVYCHY